MSGLSSDKLETKFCRLAPARSGERLVERRVRAQGCAGWWHSGEGRSAAGTPQPDEAATDPVADEAGWYVLARFRRRVVSHGLEPSSITVKGRVHERGQPAGCRERGGKGGGGRQDHPARSSPSDDRGSSIRTLPAGSEVCSAFPGHHFRSSILAGRERKFAKTCVRPPPSITAPPTAGPSLPFQNLLEDRLVQL
jgi:hypothetical protein